MKIAAIGDVHGRPIWKDVFEDAVNKGADKIVFLGDYIDPYPSIVPKSTVKKENVQTFESFQKNKWDKENKKEKEDNFDWEKYLTTPTPTSDTDWEDGDDELSDEEFYAKYYKKYGAELPKYAEYEPTNYKYQTYDETMGVLSEIVELKKKNPSKIILITGNHDAHYIYPEIGQCSRYDYKNATKYKEFYKENKGLFQYAFQHGNNLFTHAGVTNSWLDFFDATLYSFGMKDDFSNLADVLNDMGEDPKSNKILNAVSRMRGGEDFAGGITWADYKETCDDFLVGMIQFVGHSKVSYIHTEKMPNIRGSITYCDVLEDAKKNMSSNYYMVNA